MEPKALQSRWDRGGASLSELPEEANKAFKTAPASGNLSQSIRSKKRQTKTMSFCVLDVTDFRSFFPKWGIGRVTASWSRLSKWFYGLRYYKPNSDDSRVQEFE